MPTSISNPASFSSVRTAFNAEGYGISTSFFAYRQGGGIVPATSGFNAIGAGTGGDPLQLSQFSGFVVPSQLAVSLVNHDLEAQSVVQPSSATTSATVGFVLSSSGQALIRTSFGDLGGATNDTILDGNFLNVSGGAEVFIENWLDGGAAGDVSAYVTKGAGSNLAFGSDSLSTYLPLSTTREWKVRASRTSAGTTTSSTSITVQLVTTSNTANVLATATITLTASATAES